MPRSTVSSFLLTSIFLLPTTTYGQTQRIAEAGPYLRLMEHHFRELTATGTDTYGPDATPMWMSVIDTRTGRLPKKPHTPKRVYRLIGAPQGTTLYWDQPLVVAAYELSRLTGKPEYEESAARYSHSHRGESTGLVKNEPDFGRWDSKVSTTEIGVWAQSLLRASEYTSNDEIFLEGIRRWARVISDQTPANGGKGAYAEHYGRCIHFLLRAGHLLEYEEMLAQARVLAKEAVDHLQDEKLFQGYPETHLYESVDGVGYLFLALMSLETGQELDLHGFGF